MDTVKIRTKFTEMSKIFKDVIDEYESLKCENATLKEQINLQSDYIDALPENIEELKEELNIVNSENNYFKQTIEKQNEAYSLMCAEKTRRYDELKTEYEKLQAKERYDVIDFQKAHKI